MVRWIRRALALDHPGGHLTPRQVAFALCAAALAAAFWGLATRRVFVAFMTFFAEGTLAWYTPARVEHPVRRLATAFVVGGMWAAIGMLLGNAAR